LPGLLISGDLFLDWPEDSLSEVDIICINLEMNWH